MKLAWTTDPHFDHAKPGMIESYCKKALETGADGIVMTGDLAESYSFGKFLQRVRDTVKKPIWFVLGNHDYYVSHGKQGPTTMKGTRNVAERLGENLHYLPSVEPVTLGAEAALVGADGWYDGGYASIVTTRVQISDMEMNPDFRWQPKSLMIKRCEGLAMNSAQTILNKARKAIAAGKTSVVVATHVPPFRECATYMGKVSDDHWAAWMTSKSTGDVLLKLSAEYPEVNFLCLCGHSHGGSDVKVADNLRVLTGEARYGYPSIQGVFDFDPGQSTD